MASFDDDDDDAMIGMNTCILRTYGMMMRYEDSMECLMKFILLSKDVRKIDISDLCLYP